MKNKVVVNIMQQPYMIVAEESREYIERVGKRVDAEMGAIAVQSHLIPKINVAILASMNICDQLLKSEEQLARQKELLENMRQEEEKQEKEDDEAKREIYRLRGEVLELKQKLKNASLGAEIKEKQKN